MTRENKTLGVGTIVKLNFLVLGLALVVFVMFRLNSGGLPNGLRALMGLPAVAPSKLTWCDTRVKSLGFQNNQGIEQVDHSWIGRQDEKTANLDFIAIEKWFGRNCTVAISDAMAVESTADAALAPYLVVNFITGQSEAFYLQPDGTFQWKNLQFRSQELQQEVEGLRSLLPTKSP